MLSQSRFQAALAIALQNAPVSIDSSMLTPQIHLFDEVDSTNRALWEIFDSTLPEGTVAIALQQSAGKGQWGHRWESNLGGLYLSIALKPNLAAADSAQLTLSTAWGIAIALRTIPGKLSGVLDEIPVKLKWINDLVVGDRKLGGILTETRIQDQRIKKAVIGVGINWCNPVPDRGINFETILQEHPTPLIESLELLAAITIVGLVSGYQVLKTEGISAILPQYLALCVNLGQTVRVSGTTGTIVGVSPTGELRVRLCGFDETEASIPELYLKPGTMSLGYG